MTEQRLDPPMTLPSEHIGLSVDDLPMFFGPEHALLAATLREAAPALHAAEQRADDRGLASELGAAGLFTHVVAREGVPLDVRSLVLCRELLGYLSPRGDSIFAVQGLGTFAIAKAGQASAQALLKNFSTGENIAAFALTEPEAGSDVAAIATTARLDGDGYRLDGEKLFISNLGLASHATVIATVDKTLGRKGLTAFVVPLSAPGVAVTAMQATAPHPIGSLTLRDVRLEADALIGNVGDGFKLAMQTLDAFRVTVGAAAVGMARRALDEAVAHVQTREQFGKPLAAQPLVQAHLADMAVDLDSARLLVLRAAFLLDTTDTRATTEVSIAKLGATEAASRVVDRGVQLLGGRGVMHGHILELLHRAIRPLRIYEGTSEIQRTIIGRALAGGR